VKELATNGIPVAVTCRVLKLARQPYYRRRRQLALGRLTPIEYEAIMTTPASQAA
jgi:transposase InsO family protein